MKWIAAAVIALFFSLPSGASNRASADPQSVVFSYGKLGVEIVIAKDDEGNLASLKVTRDGKVLDVPAEELAGISKARIGMTRVIVPSDQRLSPAVKGSFDYLEISIPCGPETFNGNDEKQIRSFDAVAFYFEKGKFHSRMRAVSAGHLKNSWKMFSKQPGEPETDEGLKTGPDNPLADE